MARGVTPLLLAVALLVGPVSQATADDCDAMIAAAGAPKYKGTAPAHTRLCRNGYVLFHNMEHKTPDWVVEDLTPSRFVGDADRTEEGNPFAADPTLPSGQRAELRDYSGSGFDRGHMAPAADMTYSVAALRESFYLSNMAPQVGIGLNRHIWADLETLARNWTCERGHLIALTGPIYDDDPPKMAKSGSNVALPTAFYKVLYDPQAKRTIAFILPNKKIDTKGKRVMDALRPFIVSVRAVESRAGLDFFAAMTPSRQNALETHKSALWPIHGGCASS